MKPRLTRRDKITKLAQALLFCRRLGNKNTVLVGAGTPDAVFMSLTAYIDGVLDECGFKVVDPKRTPAPSRGKRGASK